MRPCVVPVVYERLGVEEELAFGLVGQEFVGEPFRRSLLRVGGTEGEDEGGKRLVRDPVRMAASREESQQVEMGRVPSGASRRRSNSEATHAGREIPLPSPA